MKKTGNLIVLLVVIASSMVSCLTDGGGNKITFNTYAVVTENSLTSGKMLITVDGTPIAVPTLAEEFQVDDCVLAHVEIDYDHQPSKDYYTASFVSCLSIDKGTLSVAPKLVIDNDTFPLANLSVSKPHNALNGYLFLAATYQATIKQALSYKLVVEKGDTAQVAYDACLVAKKVNENPGTVWIENPFAINLHAAIEELGKDTILFEQFNIRQLRLNLKYFTGMNAEQQPVYKDYGQIVVALDK